MTVPDAEDDREGYAPAHALAQAPPPPPVASAAAASAQKSAAAGTDSAAMLPGLRPKTARQGNRAACCGTTSPMTRPPPPPPPRPLAGPRAARPAPGRLWCSQGDQECCGGYRSKATGFLLSRIRKI